jgi:integrase/recombinase XerC
MEDNVIPLHLEGFPETDIYEDFLSLFLGERMESTAQAYIQDVSYLAGFLRMPSIVQAVSFLLESHPLKVNQRIQAWKASMARLAPNTINRRLATIRSLLGAARSLGLTGVELSVKNIDSQRTKDVRGPDPEAVARMIASLSRDGSPCGARDEAIVRLAYELGLRRKEISSIDTEDLDLEGSRVRVKGKGGHWTVLRLPSPTKVTLKRWLGCRGTGPGPLFINLSSNSHGERLSTTSIYRIVRSAGERAGSSLPVRPHGLRRAAINKALTIAGMKEACQFSRHKDIRSLQQYFDPDENAQIEISTVLAAGTGVPALIRTAIPGEQGHDTK